MIKPATAARLTDTDKIRNEDGSVEIVLTVPARLAAFADHERMGSGWSLHDLVLGALSKTLGVPLEEGRNLMSDDEITTFQRGQRILARTNERLLGGKIVSGLRRVDK